MTADVETLATTSRMLEEAAAGRLGWGGGTYIEEDGYGLGKGGDWVVIEEEEADLVEEEVKRRSKKKS